jgi:hypothetical protein
MDPKGKGMVVNDKTKESIVNEPRDDKPSDSGSSHKKRDGKKKRHIKKIFYYDSNESSSSPRDDDDEKKKSVNSNFSFDYSRIPVNSNAHLLSIPLGKPPHFEGEDYSFWSHKMRSHLFSLHPSIWEIVENGMLFDSTDNPVFINEQIHKNAQATTVLLASLSILDPHLVNSIRENPRYTKMTPEEILGKFVSGRMMIKEARYVDEALNGPMPIYEPQTVALKETSSREAPPSKVAQVEATGINEDEMALIIKRFKTALKGRNEYSNKNKAKGKCSCFKCGKTCHFIAQCPDNENDQGDERHRKREKKKAYKKAKGEAHLGKE